MSDRSERYAVIGAGPGGLCAARWLQERGIEFDLFDRHPDVGGIWDITFPDTPMYESAHFISSKTLSGFRDFPMPDAYPDYPGHAQVLSYLRAYADRHDLRRRAELGVEVRQARPENGGWRLDLATGEQRRYAGVVAACGQQWTPFVPALAASFEGEAFHACRYRSARQLAGKRVLVVGGGNSGCDIAVDAGTVAARAVLSLRRGYWFIPKHVFGQPADVFGERGPHLPLWLERPIQERLLRLLVGDLTRLGLPAPDHRLFQTHPVLNSQLLLSLAQGDVSVRPDLREFRGRRALFTDGSEEELDIAIFATGYRRRIPVLPEDVLAEGDVSRLFLNVCHRDHPSLFVVGYFETDGGAYPLIDLQCELIARLLERRRSSPDRLAGFERLRAGRPPDLSGGLRFLDVPRMANYLRSRPYARYLTRILRDLA